MSVRNYQYGARAPLDHVKLIEDQLFLSWRYRNDLVEVEHARRATLDDLMVKRLITEISSVTKAKRVLTFACGHTQPWYAPRKKKDDGTVIKDPEEVAAEEAAAVPPEVGDVRACRACSDTPELLAAREAVHERVKSYCKLLRNASQVYWGNYMLIEAAASSANSSPTKPKFKRWKREGQIGMQIQSPKPLTFGGALAGTDTRMRIERLADGGKIQAGSRRSGRNAILHLRIGSDEHRKPIWGRWPFIMHRLPPLDAKIQWVWVQKQHRGPDVRWSVYVSVSESGVLMDPKIEQDRKGIVALDPGWRVRDEGLRVGYWRDDEGNSGEYVIPAELVGKKRHAEAVGGDRDKHFNGFRPHLVAWFRGQIKGSLPDWIRKSARTLWQWKSANRLYDLAMRWRAPKNRFPGDEAIFEEVQAWAKQDRHLHAWTAHETAKALDHRNELYRLWSVDLARHYCAVVTEDFDVPSVMGRKGLPEDASDGEKIRADRASSNRHLAAPGIFRRILIESCRARGTLVVKDPPEWTTIDCAICGVRIPWDPAPKIEHRCEACGNVIDQDDQACRNLLAPYVREGSTRLAEAEAAYKAALAAKPKFSNRQQRFRKGKAAAAAKKAEKST